MIVKLLTLLISVFILSLSATFVCADSQYAFTCENAKIKGSIKYSVLGRYNSDFKECSGIITYDEIQKQIKSVELKINPESIHSNCQWCDKIVISKKLLDTVQYPLIIFKGNDFKKDSEGYSVKGVIDLHGVTKNLSFRFNFDENTDGNLLLKGQWVLRRKDFGITWNKFLDQGGVLVGDHFTVDWEILAQKI